VLNEICFKTTLSLQEQETRSKIHKEGLETCKDKYPNELSGQRQRTAIIEQLFSSED
jgi:polar amino acid transport system ATP-binding protein